MIWEFLKEMAVIIAGIWFLNLLNDIDTQQKAILKELEKWVEKVESESIR